MRIIAIAVGLLLGAIALRWAAPWTSPWRPRAGQTTQEQASRAAPRSAGGAARRRGAARQRPVLPGADLVPESLRGAAGADLLAAPGMAAGSAAILGGAAASALDLPDPERAVRLLEPAAGRPAGPGFQPRWQLPALCPDGSDRRGARAALLADFRRLPGEARDIHLDPDLGDELGRLVAGFLSRAEEEAGELLGLHAPHPEVYVYEDVAALQRTSCVNGAGVAYYDGALHVAPIGDASELYRSVAHEYVHHLLTTARIQEPMWLQEGVAMFVAGEQWWRHGSVWDRMRREPMPFAHLVWAFPHGGDDEEFALLAYTQAAAMVQFVVALRGVDQLAPLVQQLSLGQIPPPEVFEQASGVRGAPLAAAWEYFLDALERGR